MESQNSRNKRTDFERTDQIHGVGSHVGTYSALHVKKKREETAEERMLDRRSHAGNVDANIMERRHEPCFTGAKST